MRTQKILCMTYRPGTPTSEVNKEPCQGDCYAEDDVLCIRERWTVDEIRLAMTHLLDIHKEICGNANYRLGVDYAEDTKTFIGTFYHFGALEMVTGASVQEVIDGLADVTKSYFESPQYGNDMIKDPGLGHTACQHGDEAALKAWMAKQGGFDMEVFA